MSGLNEATESLHNKRIKDSVDVNPRIAQQYYTADGAVDPGIGNAVLNKGSAGAYTLRAPTAAEAGQVLTLVSDSAFAHVVTATGLINDGITGGAKDTLTFGAFKGASISLVAVGLFWAVLVKNVVTVA